MYGVIRIKQKVSAKDPFDIPHPQIKIARPAVMYQMIRRLSRLTPNTMPYFSPRSSLNSSLNVLFS